MQETHALPKSNPANGALVPYSLIANKDNRSIARLSSASESTLSTATLAKAFRHRWLLALTVGVSLAGPISAIVWFLVPGKYTSTALLQVLPTEPKVFVKEERVAETEKTAYQKTQVALVTSHPVLTEVLKSDKVRTLKEIQNQPDPVAWLETEVKAGFIEDSDLMRISVSSTDPNEAATLVNAVLDSYLETVAKAERSAQRARLEDLQTIYLRSQDNLRSEKERLAALAKTLKTADPQALTLKQKNALEDHTLHKRELKAAQARLREAEGKLQLIQAELSNGATGEVPLWLVEEQLDMEPEIQKQKLEIQRLQKEWEEVKRVAFPGHWKIARAEEEVRTAEKELEQMRNRRHTVVAERVRKRLNQEMHAAQRKTKEEVHVQKEQVEAMLKEEKSLRSEAEKIGTGSFELEMKRAEIEQSDNVLKSLQTEMGRLQLEIQSSQSRITPVQRAEVPRIKSIKERLLAAGFAGLGAFLCGSFLISYRELKKSKIYSVEDIVCHLELKVIGTLPALSPRFLAAPMRSPMPDARQSAKILVEAISYIRTSLLAPHDSQPNQLLMIASASAKEGKTMLAAHLARSVAQTGRRTLLLDGDLRRPSLAGLFEIPAAPGFCEAVRGEVDPLNAICPTLVEGLSILPAGECCPDVLRKLTHAGVQQLFQKLRAEFDYILVDSSPLVAVSDSLLLGKHVDGVVLCIRQHVSRGPTVFTALERLLDLHIPLRGIVVNGARLDHTDTYRYLLPTRN